MPVALLQAEEPLRRALAAIDELMVARVDVAVMSVAECASVRATAGSARRNIGREPRRVEGADECLRRHQHLAAEMAAFLLRRELILEMHARRAGLDHRLHQLERVERPAEAGLGIGDDRRDR